MKFKLVEKLEEEQINEEVIEEDSDDFLDKDDYAIDRLNKKLFGNLG